MASEAEATKGFVFNHTMIRVKDPEKSLNFYCDILGMHLIRKMVQEAGKFTLYFLCYCKQSEIPTHADEIRKFSLSRPGVLELTHNWGTENDADFKYHNGNEKPQGFGHICITVPKLQEACDRFERMGVRFKKRPSDGRMKYIAFLLDPDDYWVEVVGQEGK